MMENSNKYAGKKRKGGRRRVKIDPFVADPSLVVDFKDPNLLKRFITESGKIVPRRISGLTAKHQRQVAKAIKIARCMGLLPFCAKHCGY